MSRWVAVLTVALTLGCDREEPPSDATADTDGSTSADPDGETMGEDCELLPETISEDRVVGPGCVEMGQTKIRDGAHVEFVDGTTVYVLPEGFLDAGGGFGNPGRITATNTVFTSAADEPAPGDWGCIALGEGSILDSARIEYAGAPCGVNGLAMTTALFVGGPSPRITASLLDSAGHGLIMGRDAAITGEEESAFLFNGNALPSVKTSAHAVLDVGPSVFEDFDDAILIESGGRIDGQGTLHYQTAPYVVEGRLAIGGAGVGEVDVFIEPGVEIHMLGESIEVNVDTNLTIQGTPSEPVVITSAAEDPAPGDWGCVFSSFSNPFTMQHVVFEYGGGGETCDGNAWEAQLAEVPEGSQILECTFRHSAGAGMSAAFGQCDPQWCDNTFEDNAGVDINCPGSDPASFSC